LQKSAQKYISFIKLGQKGSGKLYDEIMAWKGNPMDGVKLLEAYQVFGRWDFAVIFEADTNENALHFAGDIVRPIGGVAAMRTIPLAPLRSWG
jgi:uncharacterized protein with GYD domain